MSMPEPVFMPDEESSSGRDDKGDHLAVERVNSPLAIRRGCQELWLVVRATVGRNGRDE